MSVVLGDSGYDKESRSYYLGRGIRRYRNYASWLVGYKVCIKGKPLTRPTDHGTNVSTVWSWF